MQKEVKALLVIAAVGTVGVVTAKTVSADSFTPTAATVSTSATASSSGVSANKQSASGSSQSSSTNSAASESGSKSDSASTASSSKDDSIPVENESTVSPTASPQTDGEQKEQTIELQKVVGKTILQGDVSANGGEQATNLKGVNGAKFKVYDVTDLLNKLIQEDLESHNYKVTDSDSGQPQTTDDSGNKADVNAVDNPVTSKVVKVFTEMATIQKNLLTRAQKLNADQLKMFTQGTTAKDGETDGVFKFKVPYDGKYRAYYIVNDGPTTEPNGDIASQSDPFVLITPIVDSDGKLKDTVKVLPKSDETPAPKDPSGDPSGDPNTPSEVVSNAKLYQTGHKNQSLFDKVIEYFSHLLG